MGTWKVSILDLQENPASGSGLAPFQELSDDGQMNE